MPIENGKLKLTANASELEGLIELIPSHHARHEASGLDSIKIDRLDTPDDTTELNVSTIAHGLCPKLPNDATKYLNGIGEYEVPAGSGGVEFGTAAGTACEGNDTRLSDSRYPTAHAAAHKDTGLDSVKLDEFAAPDDNTNLNASVSAHGLCPKLSGVATQFFNGIGGFSTPEGTGGGGTAIELPGISTMFYNGIGGFSIPSASGSVFRPWITIGRTGSGADYICDGTNDNVEIQNAFNAAVSGGVVAFLAGTYNLAAHVYATAKNLHIIGFGTVILNCSTGSDTPVLYFYGSLADTEVLTENSNMGTNTITVGSVTNVQAWDIIKITCSTSWSSDGAGQDTGEMYGCVSVDSGTGVITLDQPLLRNYTTATTAIARIYRPVKISIENIEITNQSATGSYQGIQLKYARDCEVRDCTLRNNGMSGISLYTAYGVEIVNNRIYDSRLAGYGYGVVIVDATAHVNIHDCFIDRCRHTVASGTSDFLGLNRDVKIHHSTLIGGMEAGHYVIDSHRNTIDYNVTDNTIVVSADNIGFSDGTRSSIFARNHIYGGGVAAAAYEKNGQIEGGRYTLDNNYCYDITLNRDNGAKLCKSMKIINNEIYNSPGAGITLTGEFYEQITVSNNTIEDCDDEGIYVALASGSTAPANVVISANNINGAGKDGIYLRNNNSTYEIRGSVTGNVINGVDVGNTGCNGIHLYNIEGVSVTGNTVYDDTAGMATAILEDTGCNNNTIVGNTVGGGSAGVTKIGVNSVAEHNTEA